MVCQHHANIGFSEGLEPSPSIGSLRRERPKDSSFWWSYSGEISSIERMSGLLRTIANANPPDLSDGGAWGAEGGGDISGTGSASPCSSPRGCTRGSPTNTRVVHP